MGQRGPIGASNQIKVLEGRVRKDRLRREVKAPLGPPPCPDWLSPEAREVWQTVIPEVQRIGLLAQIDEGVAAAYCVALSQYRELMEKQPDITDRRLMMILAKVEARMLTAGRELGLTPAARARMGGKTETKQESDELDQMLFAPTRR